MDINEHIVKEIKQDEDLTKLYVALNLIEEVDKKYDLLLIKMRLKEIILDKLDYVEDFDTHELIKIKRGK